MKRETREWLVLAMLILAFLLCGVIAFSQDIPAGYQRFFYKNHDHRFCMLDSVVNEDSIQVKIIKVKKDFTVMKTLERPRVRFETRCSCPYKRKDVVWIRRTNIY